MDLDSSAISGAVSKLKPQAAAAPAAPAAAPAAAGAAGGAGAAAGAAAGPIGMIAAEGKKIMQAPMKAAQSVASHIGQVVGGRAPQPAAAVSLSKPKAPAIPKAPISPTTVPVTPKAPATAAPVAPKAPKAPVAPGYAGNTIAEQAAANANKNKILQGPQTSGQTAAQVAMAPSGMSKAFRKYKASKRRK